tara:strand:+ start:53 stop:826 length:774 start_codon:yes stop_codon:yes gene_type:complete
MNRQQKWVAFYTIVHKEVRRFLRIWAQTLLPPAITMTLYFVIFGTLIGSRIGTMSGFTYMQFVIPGLIMMAVVTNAYANVVSSFFGAKFQQSIEELLVSPVPNYIILIGFVAGGVARGLLVAAVVTTLSLFFSDLSIYNPLITVTVILMTAILFSLAGFINAVYANNFDDISIVPTFVLTPLIYLGGVFYSMDLLTDFWVSISKINPMLYVINAFRYGVLGISDVNVIWSFAMIAFFTSVAFIYSLHLLNTSKRLRK